MSEPLTPNKFIPVEYFEGQKDWSSRVIHDRPYIQRPYEVDVSPRDMTFGSVKVGEKSAKQIITVTNMGFKDLPIAAVRGVGDFTVTHNAPAILLRDGSFQITVEFVPARKGMATGGVYVDTGDAAGTEFTTFIGLGTGEGSVDPSDPEPDLSRFLMLGSQDINGAGAYRANNNRIRDLGDPIADLDAVNRRTAQALESRVAALENSA